METKEQKIGSKTFLITKERTFIAQCDLDMKIPPGKINATKYDVIIADCKIMDIIKDKRGNMIRKDYRGIIMEDMGNLSNDEGEELYLELLKFRFPEALKKLQQKDKPKGKEKTS